MKRERVVITGLGLICALGNTADECFENAKNGKNGIKKTTTVDTEGCYADLAAEVTDKNAEKSGCDRSVSLALNAVKQAVSDAKITCFGEKTAVIFGSCIGGVRSGERYYGGFPTKENALNMPIAPIAVKIAEEYGAKGFVTNVANACAAGTMSISIACDLIEQGKQEVAIVGGSDAFSGVPFAGFLALHALDPKGCSPFNRSEGITLGEGAGALIVESYEHAKKRGAKIYCFVSGSGITADAYDLTAPRADGEGQINAIKIALSDANCTPGEVGYVNAHGTGTKKNDEAERLSLSKVFDGTTVDVSSTKSMTGHCLGAAGAMEAVFCVKTLESGYILPTTGFDEDSSEEQDGENKQTVNVVKNTAKKANLSAVMNNSFAFGGTNASVIFTKKAKTLNEENTEIERKAVITGIGITTPFAKNISELVEKVDGRKKPDSAVIHTEISVEELLSLGIKMPLYRKMDNLGKMVTVSGINALKDGKYDVNEENSFDTGIIIGTAFGSLGGGCDFQKTLVEKGIKAGSAFKFPNTVYNAAGGHLSICSGIKGYNATLTNGSQSGLECVAVACEEIKKRRAKAILSVGADDGGDTITDLYEKIGFFDGKDATRVLSDGAASVLVEEKENAFNRGAKVYCRVYGYGKSHFSTPYGDFCVDGDGVLSAIRQALTDAKTSAKEIGALYFDLPSEDVITKNKEIKELFGDVNTLNIKEYFGDGRASTAMLCVATAALTLSGAIKSIGKSENGKKVEKIMVISSATGGSCCAVVLGKDEGR